MSSSSSYTVKELREEAKRQGLRGYSRLTKSELSKLLSTPGQSIVSQRSASHSKKATNDFLIFLMADYNPENPTSIALAKSKAAKLL